MTIDSDDSVPLPTPPPPRPAARREAIEMALRKFDGAEEVPEIEKRPRRHGWVSSHRRQFGALVTAALIAVVSVPAAFIALRDHPPTAPTTPPTPQSDRVATDSSAATGPVLDEAPAPERPKAVARTPVTALVPDGRAGRIALAPDEPKAASEAPAAPAVASPAPPPPPPPPPAAPAREEQVAGEAQNVMVTGSRIPAPNLSKQGDAQAVAERSAAPMASEDYSEFQARLRSAFRTNDRSAILGLVGFPLRVTRDGKIRTYRSSGAVEGDFDQIFTPRVRAEVLNQPAGDFSRRSRMTGNGRIWFGPTCPNAACSPAGPIRIREVNP